MGSKQICNDEDGLTGQILVEHSQLPTRARKNGAAGLKTTLVGVRGRGGDFKGEHMIEVSTPASRL